MAAAQIRSNIQSQSALIFKAVVDNTTMNLTFQAPSRNNAGFSLASTFSEEGSLFSHLGKHEVFKPIKTYPPMTMSDLAAVESMVSDRHMSKGQASPTAIDTQVKGRSL